MDADRFDHLLRTLTARPSRRGIARTLTGLAVTGTLGPLLGFADAEAKKKRKKKKKRKGRNSPPAPPPPPEPTCSDGVQNGAETDVDCGGPACPRCADGQICRSHLDCGSLRCVTRVAAPPQCAACVADADCGSDGAGACLCLYDMARLDIPAGITPEFCVSRSAPIPTTDCNCPPGRFCAGDPAIGTFCQLPCGAVS